MMEIYLETNVKASLELKTKLKDEYNEDLC